MKQYMKTTADCYQALLDGKKLACAFTNRPYSQDEKFIFMKSGEIFFNGGKQFSPSFFNPSVWYIYEEPKWYENIPKEGVLCWVTAFSEADTNIALINKYDEGTFYSSLFGYFSATPLTKEEIQVFLNNAPGEKK